MVRKCFDLLRPYLAELTSECRSTNHNISEKSRGLKPQASGRRSQNDRNLNESLIQKKENSLIGFSSKDGEKKKSFFKTFKIFDGKFNQSFSKDVGYESSESTLRYNLDYFSITWFSHGYFVIWSTKGDRNGSESPKELDREALKKKLYNFLKTKIDLAPWPPNLAKTVSNLQLKN